MKAQDAQFILRAYRSDGRYRTGDPLFAEALAETQSNPDLETWFTHEQALDDAVAHKLDGIAPPPGLRDTILVGARASRLARPWWRSPTWLAAAVVLAVLLALPSVMLHWRRPAGPDLAAFASFSLQQLSAGLHSHDVPAGVTALQADLAAFASPLTGFVDIDVELLRDRGCQSFRFAGQDVFEVCFQRNGAWFHLYVTRRDPRSNVTPGSTPLVVERGKAAAASWATATTLFTVVSRQGAETLRQFL